MNREVTRGPSIAAAVLLMVSGILSVVAAGLRWQECPGAGAAGYGCVQVQDHRYDYVLPAGPWTPVAGAAELSGLAAVLIAAALAVSGRYRLGARLRGGIMALAAAVVLVGATARTSGLAGAAAAAAWVIPLGLAYTLVWPAAAFAAAMVLVLKRSWAMAAVLLVLAAGTPLAESILMLQLPGSHDIPPWSGVYQGALTIVSGLVLAVPAFRAGRGASFDHVPVVVPGLEATDRLCSTGLAGGRRGLNQEADSRQSPVVGGACTMSGHR